MPRSYPGFDTRSSATPHLKQLFAGLKIVCRPFLAFMVPKGQIQIGYTMLGSSALPHLKQLFAGLKIGSRPFLVFISRKRPISLRGQILMDYLVV